MSNGKLNIIHGADKLITQLKTAILSSTPLYIRGHAGIGKSQIVKGFFADYKNHPGIFNDIKPVTHTLYGTQISDALAEGVPFPNKTRHCTSWLPDEILRTIWDAYEKSNRQARVALIIDEVTHVPRHFMGFLYSAVGAGQLGRHAMPPNTSVILMSNTEESGAYTYVMDPMLADRANKIHFNGPTAAEWLSWASSIELLHPLVEQVLSAEEELLYNFDPDRLVNTTFRGWEAACRTLRALEAQNILDTNTLAEHVAGLVGDQAAVALSTALEHQGIVPTASQVLNTPDTAPVPAATDIKALMTTSKMVVQVARNLKRNNKLTASVGTTLVRYLDRLPAHVRSTTFDNLLEVEPALLDHEALQALGERINTAVEGTQRTRAGKPKYETDPQY